MMKRVLALLALFATASAFVPASTTAAFGVKSAATSLAMASPEFVDAIPAILSSTAAVATEGTGEWFGVDDLRLLGVLFIGHWFILTLWFQQYGKYDEEQDFFGEIDYTRPKK